MGSGEQSIVGCFSEFLFSFLWYRCLCKQFMNNFVFPTWACAAGFNNNNKTEEKVRRDEQVWKEVNFKRKKKSRWSNSSSGLQSPRGHYAAKQWMNYRTNIPILHPLLPWRPTLSKPTLLLPYSTISSSLNSCNQHSTIQFTNYTQETNTSQVYTFILVNSRNCCRNNSRN